jgi:hypothetical protein
MTLTDRELATVLAALRFWQRAWDGSKVSLEQFAEETPLTPEEIDDFCERLNEGRDP